jgi:uncharacterized protein with HEPN domain
MPYARKCDNPWKRTHLLSRDWQLYWSDIHEAVNKILRFTDGMDQSSFLAGERTRDAVLRNLEIIGEAANTFLFMLEKLTIRWIGSE